jgi:hypothetical protein
MEILILVAIVGVIALWSVIAHVAGRLADAKRSEKNLREARSEISGLKKQLADAQTEYENAARDSKQRIQQQGQQIHDAKAECNRIRKTCDETIQRKDQEVAAILDEASQGFPWLSRAVANYETLRDFQRAEYLETKKHPALKAAEHIREVATRSKEYRSDYHIARSRLDYYETLFPWLEEYIDIDLDTLIQIVKSPDVEEEHPDPVRRYLAPGEYEQLSESERNQRALDRYLTKKKSPWELGRDYERFIGYRFEQEGWDVDYFGIFEGLSDLGRDLIVKKGSETKIVQCKYWAQHKTIHEKHIAQLFGTTIKYRIDHNRLQDSGIIGVFVTSTTLSEMAKAFADQLGIVVKEQVALDRYPIIKCNVGRDEYGLDTQIYHLPMDQQYDRTKIVKRRECYVSTVAEAERLGFRRAWRWHPEDTG